MNLKSCPSRRILASIAIQILCVTSIARAAAEPAPSLPHGYLPVPLVPQATSYSCGAASLMAALEYWNVYDAPETKLFKPLHTTKKDGTEPSPIAEVARKYGLRAEIRDGLNLLDLRDALKDGTTVILDLQAWADKPPLDWKSEWEDGHYVVLIALDPNYAYFMDPSSHGAYAYVPLLELLDRWHDYDNRDGQIHRHENLGILIHGANPRAHFPTDLIRMQ